jgi:threonine/homoserine/homoserine lactone efflux protein
MDLGIGAIFVVSFVTALSGALMPGPLLTVTIAQTAEKGFLASALLIAGHSLLELLVVIGLAFGLGRILKVKPVLGTITALGGMMLLWMGWGMVSSRALLDLEAGSQGGGAFGGPGVLGLVLTGVVVSISNPYWTVWWATVGMTLFAALPRDSSAPMRRAALIIGAFYLGHIAGDIVWYSAVGAAVATGRELISPAIYQIVVRICGALLVFLGGSFLYLLASGKLWRIKVTVNLG